MSIIIPSIISPTSRSHVLSTTNGFSGAANTVSPLDITFVITLVNVLALFATSLTPVPLSHASDVITCGKLSGYTYATVDPSNVQVTLMPAIVITLVALNP